MTLPNQIIQSLPPDDNLRVGIVLTAAPLLINVQGGRVVKPGVLNAANLAVGEVVALVRQDETWLCLGRIGNSTSAQITGTIAHAAVSAGDTTASSGFGDLTTVTTPWTKRLATSKVRVDVSFSCYTTVAATSVEFGLQLLGGANTVIVGPRMLLNNANEHLMMSSHGIATGIAAGNYTARPVWRRVSGTGTLTSDSNDWISYAVSEVD